jgi:hypothetical protein
VANDAVIITTPPATSAIRKGRRRAIRPSPGPAAPSKRWVAYVVTKTVKRTTAIPEKRNKKPSSPRAETSRLRTGSVASPMWAIPKSSQTRATLTVDSMRTSVHVWRGVRLETSRTAF